MCIYIYIYIYKRERTREGEGGNLLSLCVFLLVSLTTSAVTEVTQQITSEME
jgi:hypothetical protein